MTEKERAKKIKKAVDYTAKATIDFLSSEKMNKMLIDLFTEIYSEASEDVLENIYNVVGTRKGYIKTSKFICEDETNYAVIAKMLDDNKPYIKEQFGIYA